MIPVSAIKQKIDKIRLEVEQEKNLKNKELLEERILALEELLLEYDVSENS